VFPARYELNSYIVFRKRLVSKKLRVSQGRIQLAIHSSCKMRSLLLIESLDLRPNIQYILVSESPSCLRLEKMCVAGKAAIGMKSFPPFAECIITDCK
jgi:hypothetical protein